MLCKESTLINSYSLPQLDINWGTYTALCNQPQVKLAHSMDDKVGWLNGNHASVLVYPKKRCTKNKTDHSIRLRAACINLRQAFSKTSSQNSLTLQTVNMLAGKYRHDLCTKQSETSPDTYLCCGPNKRKLNVTVNGRNFLPLSC